MMKPLRSLWLSWLLALTVFCAGTVHSVEYRCAHVSVIRSVAVEYQEPSRQVPCKVVYHKPPQASNVLWQAQAQVGFCESRAKELVRTLERSGWSCDEIQVAAATKALEAPPDMEAELQGLAALRVRGEFAGTVTSTEAARSEPAAAPLGHIKSRADEPLWKIAPSQAKSRPEGNANLQRGASEWRKDPILAGTLARDLRKLEKFTDAAVQTGGTGFGDLNGDGQRDAAVLITFDFGGTDYVQHLVAYLYRQGTYRLAASRFIGGSHREVQSGELEAIKAGMIFLDLHVLQADDAVCCPSGIGKAMFVLDGGELTRVEQATATATP